MTRQQRKEAWISPLEASLLLSIREGVYISPDDIKQLRKAKRIDSKSYKQVSERLTLYNRKAMYSQDAPMKKPGSKSEITPSIVAKWLEDFPLTVAGLEKAGCVIPHKEEARQIVIQKQDKRKLSRVGRFSKTGIQTS